MKKTIVTVSAAILLTSGVFDGAANIKQPIAHAQTIVAQGEVVSSVNFRTAPSTSSKVIRLLPRGTKFNVLEINSNWLKVKIGNTTGYVSSSSKYVRRTGSSQSTSPSRDSQSTSPSTSTADKIINTGLQFRGTPYQFGAKSGQTRTFDCSSFTQYIFGKNGVKLPRNSRQQASVGQTVSKNNLKKGDLIFFKTGNRSDGRIDHVAVYMGNGQILHSVPSGGVQVAKFSGFWERTAVSAKRVL